LLAERSVDMAAAMAMPSFQVGDRVTVAKSRFNPMHHDESYKVGERGVVVHAMENSSVVQVRLDGGYEIVESVLPLLKRPVPHRMVSASILHLEKEKPPALPAPQDAGDPAPLLAVEEAWLRAVFKRCDTGADGRVNQQELFQSCAASPDVASFFGLGGLCAAASGGAAAASASFEASFRAIAGNDLQISWQEMCAFYRQRLVESAVANDPSGNEQDSLSQAEEHQLRALFEQACMSPESGAAASGASPAGLQKACRALADTGIFFSSRRRIRRDALEDVTAHVVEGMLRLIGGDDGDVTLAEVCNYAAHLDPEGLSLAEKDWLDSLFKQAHESGFSVADSSGRLVAREGEAMSKVQFVAGCRATPENVLLFGLKRKLNEKKLEDATRDALAAILVSACKGGSGGDLAEWGHLRMAYLASVREGGLSGAGATN